MAICIARFVAPRTSPDLAPTLICLSPPAIVIAPLSRRIAPCVDDLLALFFPSLFSLPGVPGVPAGEPISSGVSCRERACGRRKTFPRAASLTLHFICGHLRHLWTVSSLFGPPGALGGEPFSLSVRERCRTRGLKPALHCAGARPALHIASQPPDFICVRYHSPRLDSICVHLRPSASICVICGRLAYALLSLCSSWCPWCPWW